MTTTILAKDIMVTRLVTLDPDWDVYDAICLLLRKKISGAPVVDAANNLLGVFSEKCCMTVLLNAVEGQLPTSAVHAFMDRNPQTINEDTDLLSIAHIFHTGPRRRLPVLRDGKLVGLVSRRDVIRTAADLIRTAAAPDLGKSLLYLRALNDFSEAPLV